MNELIRAILKPRARPDSWEAPGGVPLSYLELQTAKEILGEVFHARPEDVEEMIRQRMVATGYA